MCTGILLRTACHAQCAKLDVHSRPLYCLAVRSGTLVLASTRRGGDSTIASTRLAMRTTTRIGLRLYAAIAFAVALFGAAASSPANVQAHTQQHDALPDCDPGSELCEARITYYATSSHVSVVGHAIEDCNGNYTLTYGYATPYARARYFPCPG